ncbi:MAG: thiamine phosphate synthase [Vicinamibacterales bacterium]
MANSPRAPERATPFSTLVSRPASEWPTLHAIVDVEVCNRAGWDPADYAAALLDGGATFLQIRAKQMGSSAFLELCDAVVDRAAHYAATIIVNDRVDLAVLSGASGVHVGQDDLGVGDARRLLGAEAIVGRSTHTPEQIVAAVLTDPTYIAVGPVFGTTTKDTGYAAVGLDLVREARRVTDKPVVAIGGVTLANALAAIEAGATMVAVISDLLAGDTPAARVREYHDRLPRS